MIVSFYDDDTRKVWEGVFSRKLPNQIQAVARRKLRMVSNARRLDDLRIPPRNRLERLSGNRDGQWSISINDQWRRVFRVARGQRATRGNLRLSLKGRDEGKITEGSSRRSGAGRVSDPVGNKPIPSGEGDWRAGGSHLRDCAGKRAITADTALRLTRFFGTSAGFWLGMQADYDLEEAGRAAGDALFRIARFDPETTNT